MKSTYQKIRTEIDEGNLNSALSLVSSALEKYPLDSYLLYLKGNIFMKKSLWGKALSCFIQSENLNNEGPAVEARKMLEEIMSFYNKDMYNH